MHDLNIPKLAADAQAKSYPASEMLDVTLRDGGFLTRFDWPVDFLLRFVREMVRAGFRYIELGYVGGVAEHAGWYEGIGANLTPEVISEITSRHRKTSFSCLVNPWRMRALCNLSELKSSGANVLRVAYNPKYRDKVWDIVARSRDARLKTFINVATISRLSRLDVDRVLSDAVKNGVEGVFFADTCSAMQPDEIRELFFLARNSVGPEIMLGLHGHDFNGMGMGNALMAAKSGADLIDVSIRGVGRGGGNVRAELWAAALSVDSSRTAIDLSSLVRAVELISTAMKLESVSLLPALTAVCNLNPEQWEEIYRTYTIQQQNDVAVLLANHVRSKSAASKRHQVEGAVYDPGFVPPGAWTDASRR